MMFDVMHIDYAINNLCKFLSECVIVYVFLCGGLKEVENSKSFEKKKKLYSM